MGSHIVVELLKNPQFHITALTRKDSQSTLPKGVHAVKIVSYETQQSIADSLQGQDVLIVTLAANAPRDMQERLVDASVVAGVRWYIPNEWGYDAQSKSATEQSIIGPAKVKTRAYIESKGLPWTSFACGFWYEWSLSGGINMYGIDSTSRRAILYSGGNIPIDTSTWSQAARGVAAFLALPILRQDDNDDAVTMDRWQNKFVRLASFHLTHRQMLDAVQRVTKTTDADWQIETPEAETIWQDGMEKMQKGDRSGFAMCLYSRAFFTDEECNMQKRGPLDNDILRLPMNESLDDFTEVAVRMAKDHYVDSFMSKLHQS